MSASAATTPADRAAARRDRNREIARAREEGATWEEIGERFGISDRHARRCFIEYLRAAGHIDLDADETFSEILNVHVWALEELRVLAMKGDNDSARVGAVRSRVAVAHDLLKLMEAAGILLSPEQSARLRLRAEKESFAAAIIDALEARGIDFEEIADEIDRALHAHTLPEAAAA